MDTVYNLRRYLQGSSIDINCVKALRGRDASTVPFFSRQGPSIYDHDF